MGKTAFQKIVKAHLKKTFPDDGTMVLEQDHVWCHEITTPLAISPAQACGCDVVFNPNRIKAIIDHVSPAKDSASAIQGLIMRQWSKKHGIQFLDVGRNGVCHATIPEMGWILPGETGTMGDSHTTTEGAFCAFTTGSGTTALGLAIITGLLVCAPQKIIRVDFVGELPANIFAKDLILALLKKISVKGATNSVVEFGGPVIDRLSMDARMTLTNMIMEAGATGGMINVDQETIRYLWPLLKKDYSSPEKALAELSYWNSDPDCSYNQRIEIDISNLVPLITQGYSPDNVVPVAELAGKPVDQVYIGSCVNGRLEDLLVAASIFQTTDKPVANGIRCIIVPATPDIWQKANQLGLLDTFMKAGCCVTNPSCGACLGMSCGVLAPEEVCVATTNRNFRGRMGEGGMVHLASPATAAMTAINGIISVPSPNLILDFGKYRYLITARPSTWEEKPVPKIDYAQLAAKQLQSAKESFSGPVFYLPPDKADNIDTDQIIPAHYLNLADKKAFGPHCLEGAGLLPKERKLLQQSRILVAGENFGGGSSREQAVYALEAVGIYCVIALSFSRIFWENMFNNGLLCISLNLRSMDILLEDKPQNLIINLETQTIKWGEPGAGKWLSFTLTDYQKELLKSGGATPLMLKLAAEIWN